MASQSFEQSRLSVPAARDWVLVHVSDLPSDLVEIAALLASELVTNAVLYGAGHFQVSVERFVDRHRVRVGVTDAGAGHPTPQSPDDTAEHGRGLQLVNALAAAWGVQRQKQTKTVWFELPTQRSPGESTGRSSSEPHDRSPGRTPARSPGEPRLGSPERSPGEPHDWSAGHLPDHVHPPGAVAITPAETTTRPDSAGAPSRWGRFYTRLVRRLWNRSTR